MARTITPSGTTKVPRMKVPLIVGAVKAATSKYSTKGTVSIEIWTLRCMASCGSNMRDIFLLFLSTSLGVWVLCRGR